MIKVDKEIICVCVCIPSQTWNKDEKKYENNEEKNLHDQYLKV